MTEACCAQVGSDLHCLDRSRGELDHAGRFIWGRLLPSCTRHSGQPSACHGRRRGLELSGDHLRRLKDPLALAAGKPEFQSQARSSHRFLGRWHRARRQKAGQVQRLSATPDRSTPLGPLHPKRSSRTRAGPCPQSSVPWVLGGYNNPACKSAASSSSALVNRCAIQPRARAAAMLAGLSSAKNSCAPKRRLRASRIS